MLKGNVRRQFKVTLQEVHGKAKLVKDQETLTSSPTQEELPKKKVKGSGENLDSSCSIVQLEESANSANTLSIESISKSEDSTKLSIMIASSSERSSADENGRKIVILSEISKLNSLSEKIKPRKRSKRTS